MLSKEETQRLVALAKDGSEYAKERLIQENSPLIKSVIRRFRGKGVEYEDLYQIGSIGFLKAIANFSEAFGVKFTTYAVPMICGEVMRFLRDDGSVKVSRTLKALAVKITAFSEEYRAKTGASPTVALLSDTFQVDAQEIVYALGSTKPTLSLYQKESEEDKCELIDRLPAGEDAEDVVERIAVKDAIATLSEREQTIVALRYFRDKTQADVALTLGISQVQVSRIESSIIKKLRERLEEEHEKAK